MFTSRGRLSDKKQPSFTKVGFTLVESERKKKEKNLSTINCFASCETSLKILCYIAA